MKSILKNVGFAVALVFLVWLAYIVYSKEPAVDELTVSNSQSDAVIQDQKLIARIAELKQLNIEIKSKMFKDEEFLSLVNYPIMVTEEDAGRENPFSPVPGLVLTDAQVAR
jgi:hypothetical protein